MRPRPGPVAAAAAALPAALLAFAAVPGWRNALWGLNAWTFLGPGGVLGAAAGALAAAGVVYAAPPFPDRFRSRAAFALLALPVFYLLRDRAHLLGDGRLWLSVLHETRAYHAHEPLAFLGTSLFTADLARASAQAVAFRAEILSVLAGGAALVLLFALAARVAAGARGRWVAFGLLASSGCLQFGFGYVESYPWEWLAVLGFLVAALGASEGAVSVVVPAFLFGLAAGVHGMGLLLFPVLAAVFAARRPLWLATGTAILAAAVPLLFAYLVLPRFMPQASGGAAGVETATRGVGMILGEVAPPRGGPERGSWTR